VTGARSGPATNSMQNTRILEADTRDKSCWD